MRYGPANGVHLPRQNHGGVASKHVSLGRRMAAEHISHYYSTVEKYFSTCVGIVPSAGQLVATKAMVKVYLRSLPHKHANSKIDYVLFKEVPLVFLLH